MADFRSNRIPLSSAIQRIEHVSVKRGLPIILIGAPGSAKSACVMSLTRRLQNSTANFGGCYINASNKEAPHFYGFQKIANGPLDFNAVPSALQPVPAEGLRGAFPVLCPPELTADAEGNTHPIPPMPVDLHYTDQLTKSRLVTYDHNIVVVDELTKIMHESVMGTLAGVAHEAMFGDWHLPKDTTGRVFIGNDVGHQSLDVPIPAHFINRCQKYFVYTDFPAVEAHWTTIGMDPLFLLFAKEHSKDVFSETVPDTSEPFSTARSFDLAWRAMSAECQNIYDIKNVAPAGMPYRPEEWPFYVDRGNGVMREIEMEMRATLASYCGEDVALRFAEFALGWQQRPRIEDVLNTPTTAKVPDHPGIMEAVLTMCAQAANAKSLSTICRYVERSGLANASIFCSKIKNLIPTVASSNPDFMNLLNKSGAVARNIVFGS